MILPCYLFEGLQQPLRPFMVRDPLRHLPLIFAFTFTIAMAQASINQGRRAV